MSVTVYGASDDLIEVEGDINEEFNPRSDDDGALSYLAFSDGTVLSVEYGKGGIWRVNRVVTGSATYWKVDGTDTDGDYTDGVTLGGDPLKWVVFGDTMVRAGK